MVMPIIDGLSREFKYSPGGVELVGFNTRLVDHGIALQKIHQFEGRTAVDPEPSPAMAGGLFSVHREYFFEIGTRALSRCRCCFFCCCYLFVASAVAVFAAAAATPTPALTTATLYCSSNTIVYCCAHNSNHRHHQPSRPHVDTRPFRCFRREHGALG